MDQLLQAAPGRAGSRPPNLPGPTGKAATRSRKTADSAGKWHARGSNGQGLLLSYRRLRCRNIVRGRRPPPVARPSMYCNRGKIRGENRRGPGAGRNSHPQDHRPPEPPTRPARIQKKVATGKSERVQMPSQTRPPSRGGREEPSRSGGPATLERTRRCAIR